jgi:glutamate decarboxylase
MKTTTRKKSAPSDGDSRLNADELTRIGTNEKTTRTKPPEFPVFRVPTGILDEFNLEVPDCFPEHILAPRAAQNIVNSEAWTDASPMLNLSSFVTTFSEPEEAEVARVNIMKNYIDHDMYPQVFAMETRMVKWLHGLWNGPKNAEPYGTATVGSSEACMLAVGAQMELAEGPESQKDATSPTGDRRERPDRLEKFLIASMSTASPLEVGNYRLTTKHLDNWWMKILSVL